jgi:hypothetical protein
LPCRGSRTGLVAGLAQGPLELRDGRGAWAGMGRCDAQAQDGASEGYREASMHSRNSARSNDITYAPMRAPLRQFTISFRTDDCDDET